MKRNLIGIIAMSILIVLSFVFCTRSNYKLKNKSTMKITSTAFTDSTSIPLKYTCQGDNINPELKIEGVPENAKSLALIMDDPDAPMGTWVHWVVWNISPDITTIPQNSVPAESIEGITSFGKSGYGGPCPPKGVHRYYFKLYALNDKLNIPKNSNKEDLLKAMDGKIIQQAELMGTYIKIKN